MQYTLKELRARKNETQAQTAAAIGVSQTTYNAWEKDISNVAISKVAVLAAHFGVKISEIFFAKQLELNSREDAQYTQL